MGTYMGGSAPAMARQVCDGFILLSTVMLKNEEKKVSWAGYAVRLKDGLTPPETRTVCAQLFKAYEKKNIIIEREPDMGDHPGEPEPPAATGEM